MVRRTAHVLGILVPVHKVLTLGTQDRFMKDQAFSWFFSVSSGSKQYDAAGIKKDLYRRTIQCVVKVLLVRGI